MLECTHFIGPYFAQVENKAQGEQQVGSQQSKRLKWRKPGLALSGSLFHQPQGEGKEQEARERQPRFFPFQSLALPVSHLLFSLRLGLHLREVGSYEAGAF